MHLGGRGRNFVCFWSWNIYRFFNNLMIKAALIFREDEPRVIATARGTFDHRGGLLESQETNVSIYIPAGALPEGKKQEVYFKVCQDSKYMPPLDSGSGKNVTKN